MSGTPSTRLVLLLEPAAERAELVRELTRRESSCRCSLTFTDDARHEQQRQLLRAPRARAHAAVTTPFPATTTRAQP